MFHYFISYAHSDKFGNGFGHCSIVRSKPITTIEEINSIAEKISHNHQQQHVIILNYQLLRKEPDTE